MTDKNHFVTLPDLDRKIEEAFHDAINEFEKKCPYCDKLLFSGHIRKKIHLDHFIPINRGGQHVPWNILPSCQGCNSKKSDKSPQSFLTNETFEECQSYLNTVRDKYVGQLQKDLDDFQQIKSLVNQCLDKGEPFLPIFRQIFKTITGQEFDMIEVNTSSYDIDREIETAINSSFKPPESKDLKIIKMSATEVTRQIQHLIPVDITRNQVGKKLKELGFNQKLERNGSKVQRVYYLSPL
jgi:hypothetical protein